MNFQTPIYPDRMSTIGQRHSGGLFTGRSISVLSDGKYQVRDEWIFPPWEFSRLVDMESEAESLRKFKERGWSREALAGNDRNPYKMLSREERRLTGTENTGPR